MKTTDINNPDIEVKDKRLIELDHIVAEVKESEEWEAVRMDILDVGINLGITKGIDKGELKKIILLVSRKKNKNLSVPEIADMLEEEPELIQQIYDTLDNYNAETEWEEILQIITATR